MYVCPSATSVDWVETDKYTFHHVYTRCSIFLLHRNCDGVNVNNGIEVGTKNTRFSAIMQKDRPISQNGTIWRHSYYGT